MILTNKATDITAKWLSDNHYWDLIKSCKDVNSLKRWVSDKLWGLDDPTVNFIKGSDIINWESILKSSHVK